MDEKSEKISWNNQFPDFSIRLSTKERLTSHMFRTKYIYIYIYVILIFPRFHLAYMATSLLLKFDY